MDTAKRILISVILLLSSIYAMKEYNKSGELIFSVSEDGKVYLTNTPTALSQPESVLVKLADKSIGTFDVDTLLKDKLDAADSSKFARVAHQHLISDVTGLQTALDGKQPLNTNLTAIAGLTHSNRHVMVSNGSSWTRRALEEADLPSLSISKITGLQTALDSKEPAITGTANKVLSIQADGTGVKTGSIYDDGNLVGFEKAFIGNSSSTGIRHYHDVYLYSNPNSTETGILKIVMPQGWTDTFQRITIKGYNYVGGQGAWECIIGGYNYNDVNDANDQWINYSAEIRGSAPFSIVRLGYDGSKCVILLGTTETVWRYAKVAISDMLVGSVLVGSAAIYNWETGWSASIITSETGLTKIVAPTVNSGVGADWNALINKPSTFTPSTHSHPWGDITGKPSTFAPAAHGLVSSTHTVSGLTAGHVLKALSATTYGFGAIAWSEIASKPSTFTPSAHSHAWNDITGKPSTFAPAAHTLVSHTDWSTYFDQALKTTSSPTFASINISNGGLINDWVYLGKTEDSSSPYAKRWYKAYELTGTGRGDEDIELRVHGDVNYYFGACIVRLKITRYNGEPANQLHVTITPISGWPSNALVKVDGGIVWVASNLKWGDIYGRLVQSRYNPGRVLFNTTYTQTEPAGVSINGTFGVKTYNGDAQNVVFHDIDGANGNFTGQVNANIALIGKTTATGGYKLEVEGNTLVNGTLKTNNSINNTGFLQNTGYTASIYPSNSSTHYRDVYQYSASASSLTGTMKFTLPKSWSSTMLTFTIKGYNYATGQGAWECIIGGYNGANWRNCTAEIRGTAPFSQVRLAHDGTKCCLLLGNTSTNWYYPQVAITEVFATYNNHTDWGEPYSMSFITSETGIGNVVTPPTSIYGNIAVVPGDASIGGKLNLYDNIQMRNSAGTGWLDFVTRNTSWGEVVADINNVGTINIGTPVSDAELSLYTHPGQGRGVIKSHEVPLCLTPSNNTYGEIDAIRIYRSAGSLGAGIPYIEVDGIMHINGNLYVESDGEVLLQSKRVNMSRRNVGELDTIRILQGLETTYINGNDYSGKSFFTIDNQTEDVAYIMFINFQEGDEIFITKASLVGEPMKTIYVRYDIELEVPSGYAWIGDMLTSSASGLHLICRGSATAQGVTANVFTKF